MAVPVGSAFAEFYLEYQSLRGSVDEIKSSLGELREANDQLLASIRDTGEGMAAAMKTAAGDLKTLKPFDSVVQDAQRARKNVKQTSQDMTRDVAADLKALKSSLESNPTYAPLIKSAQEASATADKLSEKLTELKLKEEAVAKSGLTRADLSVFFDAEGRTRDARAVPYAQADAATRDRPALQRPGGRVMDTNAQRAEIERLLENVPQGTAAARLGSDVEAAKALAESTRDAYDEVASLERQVAELRKTIQETGTLKVDIGESFRDADEALTAYNADLAKVAVANTEVAKTQAEINRLRQLGQKALGVAEREDEKGAAGDEKKIIANFKVAEKAARDLEAQEASLIGQQQGLDAANANLANSINLVAFAQERLNKAIGSEPGRRSQKSPAEIGGNAPRIDKAIEQEAAARQRAAEEEIRHSHELAEIRLRGEQEVTAIREQNIAKIKQAEIEAAATVDAEIRRGETSRAVVAEEHQAAIDKENINAAGKIERERIAGVTRLAALEKKALDDRAKEEARHINRGAEEEQRKLSKIEQIRERFRLRAEERDKRAATRAAQAAQGGTGFTREETALVAKLRAEKEYAVALDIVKRKLDAVNLSEVQRLNLGRLQAQITNQMNRTPGGGGGPPPWLNTARSQFLQLAGAIGLATSAAELFAAALRQLKAGFDTLVKTDETRRAIGVFIDNIDRGNRVMDTAIDFGRQYGYVQGEMAEAARVLAPQVRLSNVALEKQFEIVARLATRNPDQGFTGAAFAIGELSAGDIQSMRDRFNIPAQAAREMKAQIESGMDVFVVLDKTLARLGITSEALGQRMQGTAGQVRSFTSGWDQLRTALASTATDGAPILGFFGKLLSTVAASYRIFLLTSRAYAEMFGGLGRIARAVASMPVLFGAWGESVRRLLPLLKLLGPFEEVFRAMVSGENNVSGATERVSDAMSVAKNRFNEGRISAAGYAKELRRIADTSHIDLSGAIVPPEAKGSLEQLTNLLDDYHRRAALDPGFAAKNLPQIIAVADEIVRLKALSPIVITAELRMEFAKAGLQALQNIVSETQKVTDQVQQLDSDYTDTVNKGARDRARIWTDAAKDIARIDRDYYAQRAKADRDFNAQMARQARDFQRSLDRSDRDFRRGQQRQYADYLESITRSTRDYNRGRSRALRDHEQEERKAEADHTQDLVKIRQDADDKLVEIQKNTRDRLKELRRDFDVDRKRETEDFELERAVLLAEGRVAEARVLESRHRVEQRRAEEDLARGVSDVVDEGDKQGADVQTQRDKQLAEAQKGYDDARKERQAAWDQMRTDQQSDFDLQLEDARAAYVKARDQAAADRKQARDDAIADNALARADSIADREKARNEADADHEKALGDRRQQAREAATQLDQTLNDEKVKYEKQRQAILDNLDQYVANQKTKLAEAAEDMIATRRLVESGIPLEQAELIVAVQRNNAEWQRVLGDMGDIAGFEGVHAATDWMRQLGNAMIEGAKQVDQIIQPPKISPGPRVPARPVPVLPAPNAPPARPAPRTDIEMGGRSIGAYIPYAVPVAAPPGAAAAADSQRPIFIQLQAGVSMDGQSVGRLVAPVVATVFEQDLEVSAQVVESAFTPGVHQRAFRRPLP